MAAFPLSFVVMYPIFLRMLRPGLLSAVCLTLAAITFAGGRASIQLEETDANFAVGWKGTYHLDGPAFIYTDRRTRRVTTILGNPTQAIARQVSSPAGVLDFRDFNKDGYPDIAYVALNRQIFPLFRNTGRGDFVEVTTPSGDESREHGHGGIRSLAQ